MILLAPVSKQPKSSFDFERSRRRCPQLLILELIAPRWTERRRLLCRFLDAGNKEVPHAQPTGVQKAPRHEVAGSSAPAELRALRGFVRGARLRKFEEWRPRPRAQLKRYGTIVAK